jgi:hypothetical protein
LGEIHESGPGFQCASASLERRVVEGVDTANRPWPGRSHFSDHGGGGLVSGNTSGSNNYATRYYLAVTKHLDFQNIGEWGIHAAFVYGNAKGMEHYKRPSFGTNFRFQLLGDQPLIKAVNNLNLMAEYDARTVNIGAHYQLWKDHINLIAELNNGKYFSGGIYFKIHLK